MDEHLPPVFIGQRAHHQFLKDHPVNQTNNAVMTKSQPLGQFTHGDVIASGESLNGQQRLMLLRCEADSLCRLLAEMDEPAELVTKCRKRFILRLAKFFRPWHRGRV